MDYWRTELRNIDYKNRPSAVSAPARRGLVASVIAAPWSTAAARATVAAAIRRRADGATRSARCSIARCETGTPGDLAGYMEGYEKSDRLRFHSGGDVTLGWQTVHDSATATATRTGRPWGSSPSRSWRSRCSGPQAALAYGRWRLQRAQDEPSGLFTCCLRKHPEGWRIRYDHTSSASDAGVNRRSGRSVA